MRICDLCGGVDDHPRHVIAYAAGDGVTPTEAALKAMEAAGPLGVGAEIMAQISDTSTTMRHMDCCREAGCPDGTCNEVTAGAEDLKGDKLVKHLTKGN
jgi:hypothetical protein